MKPLAYSIDELSTVTGLCRAKLYKDIASGKLEAKKAGSRTLVLHDEANRYLHDLPNKNERGEA